MTVSGYTGKGQFAFLQWGYSFEAAVRKANRVFIVGLTTHYCREWFYRYEGD